jgi:hypothetical protein
MFGRLPWFALERRMRALRFLVFFDIADQRNGVIGLSDVAQRTAFSYGNGRVMTTAVN